jgi:ATP-binding cassette subfamily B protein
MTLLWHRRRVSLPELRAALGSGRDGTSAWAIKEAAERHGLRCTAVTLTGDDLPLLTAGAILHWRDRHFVVFERLSQGRVHLLDPATGRSAMDVAAFKRAFGGVALLFTATVPGSQEPPGASGGAPGRTLILASKRAWLGVLLVSLAVRALGLVGVVLLAAVLDRIVPRHDSHLLRVVAAAASAVLLLQALGSVLRNVMRAHLQVTVGNRLSVAFLDRLIRSPQSFFDDRSAGDLRARLDRVAEIEEALTKHVLCWMVDGVVGVVSLAVIVLAAPPPLAVVVVLVLAVEVALSCLAGALRMRLAARERRAARRLKRHQDYMFSAMEMLRANGLERDAFQVWAEAFAAGRRVQTDRSRLLAALEALVDFLRSGGPVVVLLCGAGLALRGRCTIGALVAVEVLTMQLTGFLAAIGSTLAELRALRSRLAMMDDVLEAAPAQDAAGRVILPGSAPARFEADRVTFRHSPQGREVITSLSLTVDAGELLAIVGPSGSGKSTLAGLLLGLYRPTDGEILIDGTSASTLDLSAIRGRFAVIGRVPFVFGGTILENLTLKRPGVSMEEVVRAAKGAQLHDEVVGMPLGYQTRLGSGGVGLSSGQGQRLALARALLRAPRALVLDDATSSLDPATEAGVFRALEALACTRIVIAHRLSTVAPADRIVVMDQGAIVEEGSHQELLCRRGAYHRLMRPQFDPGGGR